MTKPTFKICLNNFKVKILQSTNCMKNQSVKNNINYNDHPQSIAHMGKDVHLSLEMYKKFIEHEVILWKK